MTRTVGNALLDAVARTVREHPCAPVFRKPGCPDVTYSELWEQASLVATSLLEEVPGRAPVLVLGEKDASTVAAFLGCLMSGHAYVPIDASLPVRRVRDIAGQIDHVSLIATCDVTSELEDALSNCRIIRPLAPTDAPACVPKRSVWVSGEDTQYVIFTSGSTGRPKGIEVTAANVAAFMSWLVTFPVVRAGGRTFLDQAHYSFDLSEYELVGALATGGCLCAAGSGDALDFGALLSDLEHSGVEVWVSTPSFADLCLADPSFNARLLPRLRLLLFCGETLHHTTAAALRERFPRAIVANTYGPTESTVAVTYGEIADAELADPEPLPVGRPRPGTELRIVDHETGSELPQGETGEIVICGDTVAKGYYADPEKTASAFFSSRLTNGASARAYRTGDLGRIDREGRLRYEGRLDSLVKVNGFRIELTEVEGALEEVTGVTRAAVVPRERRGRVTSLVAFVVLDRAEATDALGLASDATDFDLSRALREALGRVLPAYMVPRTVRVVDNLPLTVNEKVDRRSLAATVSGRR